MILILDIYFVLNDSITTWLCFYKATISTHVGCHMITYNDGKGGSSFYTHYIIEMKCNRIFFSGWEGAEGRDCKVGSWKWTKVSSKWKTNNWDDWRTVGEPQDTKTTNQIGKGKNHWSYLNHLIFEFLY